MTPAVIKRSSPPGIDAPPVPNYLLFTVLFLCLISQRAQSNLSLLFLLKRDESQLLYSFLREGKPFGKLNSTNGPFCTVRACLFVRVGGLSEGIWNVHFYWQAIDWREQATLIIKEQLTIDSASARSRVWQWYYYLLGRKDPRRMPSSVINEK